MAKKEPFRLLINLTSVYMGMLAVFLLITAGYEDILKIKIPAFYAICGGYVGLSFIFCLESMMLELVNPKDLLKKLIPNSPVQILLLLYLLFSLIAAILSPYSETWVGATRNEGLITIAIYVLSFYFIAKFFRPQKWMIYLLGLAVVFNGILSVVQLAGAPIMYPGGHNYYEAFQEYSGIFVGTIGNVDFVAAFFALSIPLFFLYVVKAEEEWRFFLLIPAFLSLGILLKIWVLLGLMGVAAAAVVCIPPLAKFKKRGVLLYWLGLGGLALVGVAALYFIPFGSGLPGELHSILHGNISEKFGTGRIYIWAEVLKRIPENLFFGTGPDTLAFAQIEPFRRIHEQYGELISKIDTAHNEYLNILYHQGIFALLSYLAALALVVVRFFKLAAKNKGILIFGTAIIGYLVGALFGIGVPLVSPYFWVCLGIFEYYMNQKE